MEAKDYFQIQNMIYRYADLLDAGEIETLADLFAYADFYKPTAAFRRDPKGLATMWREWVRMYPEAGNTPATRHIISNVTIEPGGEGRARAKSYLTVLQATRELPLQPIIVVTHADIFQSVANGWRFLERKEEVNLVGHLTSHLLQRLT
jgi:3-phenylpropionate/cinnamic acid dioxygenase small subunit